MDNVIEFPARASEPTVLEFEIGIGSVDEARRTLECLLATVTLGLKMVESTESEAKILAELHNLFAAFHTLVLRARGIQPRRLEPMCALPKFRQRSEDRACEDPPSAS
jgi:hypothetical protein